MNILTLFNILLASSVGLYVFLKFRRKMKSEGKDNSVQLRKENYKEIFSKFA